MSRSIPFLSGALAMGLALSIGAAEPAPNEPGRAEAGESAEAAVLCVNLARIRSTRVLDDRTILFEMSGGETLVNRLPNRCPGLGFEKRFAYKTSLSQLCNTDIITVITSMGRGASCGLGTFSPYVPPEEVEKPGGDGKLEPVED